MKYIVKCQAASGEIIHEYSLEAKSKQDAYIANHSHPECDRAAMMAYEKGICEYQFVIYPITDMN